VAVLGRSLPGIAGARLSRPAAPSRIQPEIPAT